jgi:uncharacterized protein
MKIPDKVKQLFNRTSLISFGTADANGIPNINVVFWKTILNDETILLIDNFMHTSKKNLSENDNVCLSFWDAATEEAYKVKGKATYYIKGNIYNAGKKFIQLAKPDRVPKGVVEINIQEIYILTPGPNAGKKI